MENGILINTIERTIERVELNSKSDIYNLLNTTKIGVAFELNSLHQKRKRLNNDPFHTRMIEILNSNALVLTDYNQMDNVDKNPYGFKIDRINESKSIGNAVIVFSNDSYWDEFESIKIDFENYFSFNELNSIKDIVSFTEKYEHIDY